MRNRISSEEYGTITERGIELGAFMIRSRVAALATILGGFVLAMVLGMLLAYVLVHL